MTHRVGATHPGADDWSSRTLCQPTQDRELVGQARSCPPQSLGLAPELVEVTIRKAAYQSLALYRWWRPAARAGPDPQRGRSLRGRAVGIPEHPYGAVVR
jgi:hypothetical protein